MTTLSLVLILTGLLPGTRPWRLWWRPNECANDGDPNLLVKKASNGTTVQIHTCENSVIQQLEVVQ